MNCLNFFQDFLKLSCHLWSQFSQLLKGQFGKFLCLSHRKFPEVFKTPPTFLPTPFQSGVIAKKQDHTFFLGHPVHILLERYREFMRDMKLTYI